MKKHHFITLLILTVCLFSTQTISAQKKGDYDIFIFIGQSNCAGRGYMLAQDTTEIIQNVWLLNSQGLPEPAKAPLNKYSNIRKTIKMQMISPSNSFCQEVSAATGRKILLIQNARGGSGLASWAPGGDGTVSYLDSIIVRAKPALKYGKVKAIIWHQGETDIDGGTAGAIYETRFVAMIKELKKQLGISKRVPVLTGEVGQWPWTDTNKIQAFNHGTLNILEKLVSHCHKVSSDGLKCRSPQNLKDPHFSRDAQIELGKRYAQKYLSVTRQK